MASRHQMRVELATIADIPHIIDLVNEGLNPEGLIYPLDANGNKYATGVFEALIKAENDRVSLFVVRDIKGTPISTGTVYIIKAGESAYSAWSNWGIPLQPGVSPNVLDQIFNGWPRRHNAIMNPTARIFIEALVTRKTWQGQGCASAILAKADEVARRLDYCSFLDAIVVEFYERRGYSVISDASGVEASDVPMLQTKTSERS